MAMEFERPYIDGKEVTPTPTQGTWLGNIVRQSFIDAWNTLQTRVNDAIGSMGLDWFPATVVRDSLKTLNNLLNDLFEPAVGVLGQSIGDKTTEKLESDLLDTKNRIETEFNKLLSNAKTTLQAQISSMNTLLTKARTQIADLESAKNNAIDSIEDLDVRLRDITSRATNELKALETAKNRLFAVTGDLEKRVKKLEATQFKLVNIPSLAELLMK